MNCPVCGSECNYVKETAQGSDGKVYRRRHCRECDAKFHTVESVITDDETNKRYSEAIQKKSPLLRGKM